MEGSMKLQALVERLEATNADFSGSQFTNVAFAGSRFVNVNFAGAAFEDVNMAGWRVHNANFSGLTLQKSNLAGASFVDCRLSGMRIDGVLVESMLAAYNALMKGSVEDAVAAVKALKQEKQQ
jgi:uncharacterized protein YjbI with pentapeptide repeats